MGSLARSKIRTNVKCVLVGDGEVGKTCLLVRYCRNDFRQTYVPTVFDNTSMEIRVDDYLILLDMWDTAGQETYDRLRPLSYPGTDVFLLCFSMNNRESFNNIKEKWLPELRHLSPDTPIVLVATKKDLRDKLSPKDTRYKKMISKSQGQRLSHQIKAYAFVESSALKGEGVKDAFEEAVRAVLAPKMRPKFHGKCVVL